MYEIIEQPLRKILSDLADDIEAYAVESVDDYHAVATPRLRGAIHVRLEGNLDSGYQIICYAEGQRVAYAQYVHEGREPGKMPPINPLMEWAKKKAGRDGKVLFGSIGKGMVNRTRLIYNKDKSRIRGNKADKTAFDAARQIAWAVAKSIERDGIPAKPFFRDAVMRALKT